MKTATRYQIRRMTLDDIPQVLEIERESFPGSWPPTAFKREIQQNRLAHYIVVGERNPDAPTEHPEAGAGHPGPLGRFIGEIRHILSGEEERPLPPPEERKELIVGFVGVWMMPDEAHIVTIASRGTHRRRGIGEALLISSIELAQELGQSLMTLEVRVSNEAALRLYEKYGFQIVGRRPRYYSDNHEDAYILTVDSVLSRRYGESFEQLRGQHRAQHGEFAAPEDA
jgi:ribosomal-protein-alanine N-acetyltransferase